MKKLWSLPISLPLVISPLAIVISCDSNNESINQDDEWANRFQSFYLRKATFTSKELDLPQNVQSASWTIDLDWLWNQKLDQIFYQDRIKQNFISIWDYQVERFDQGLKVNVQFMKKTITNRPQISPILEFKITGFNN